MATTPIQIDAETAAALLAQAKAMNLSLEAYLQTLALANAMAGIDEAPSLTELDRVLDELGTSGGNVPVLPAGFSRRDVYGEHD